MNHTHIPTRNGADRLRYSVLFELTLIALLAPLGAMILEREMVDIGLLAGLLSVKAMLLNLIYNWLFDQWDIRAGRIPTQRSFLRRILHAVGFETFLVITSLPIVIWWLKLTLLQALLTDLAATSIVVVYTLVFSWIYDQVFPVTQTVIAENR